MTDDEIALWLITKGTMEDKPIMALAADRILTLRAERDRLRAALEYILAECTLSDNTTPSVGAIKYAARAALKGDTP